MRATWQTTCCNAADDMRATWQTTCCNAADDMRATWQTTCCNAARLEIALRADGAPFHLRKRGTLSFVPRPVKNGMSQP